MMRVCHLDTCPVGVATQNPDLRARFTGQAEHVVNFFMFLAEEVREYLAVLGFRSLDEAIGHSELLDANRAISHWKADGLDLTPILSAPKPNSGPLRRFTYQDHQLEKHFDHSLIKLSTAALEDAQRVEISLPINNTAQAVGTMLGHEVTKLYGVAGLPEGTIDIRVTGSAGQSFGAFIPKGIKLSIFGDSNDYVGKGLSGGLIVVRPSESSVFPADQNVIAGNVIGYGATSGSMFLSGIVGERFLVRNSGAVAVVEGVGDHGLEYMTGGTAVILGRTGKNFAAGMSGGVAYVYNLRADLVNHSALVDGEIDLLPLDELDAETLRALLTRHELETRSKLATKMLAEFDNTVSSFTKVLPRDYANVKKIQAAAVLNGEDLDGSVVWQRILEVSTNGRS
jgi:glutamate synthase (NADPH/NADH) large chain